MGAVTMQLSAHCAHVRLKNRKEEMRSHSVWLFKKTCLMITWSKFQLLSSISLEGIYALNQLILNIIWEVHFKVRVAEISYSLKILRYKDAVRTRVIFWIVIVLSQSSKVMHKLCVNNLNNKITHNNSQT